MQTTKEIETPLGKHKVVIKTMLTGAEREEVDNAEMKYLKTEDGKSFQVTDMAKVGLAKKHALLSTSVVTIDDDGAEVLKRLQKMYEPDYSFVYEQIEIEQKKMTASTSAA
ncbi:hypothetical protein ACGYLM_01560 [Sulfitobacter sp. 1A10445]|uniref:hypothetical protein n=1 Tax=unclassified Sulfitobacter TaxID=196795 RepID=UPI003745ACA6